MSTTKRPQPTTRKPRAPRRARRALADSDDEVERLAHSSDSDHSTDSDPDTDDTDSSSDDDELDTPAAPATATDHSVSPPSKRTHRKGRKPPADSTDVPIVAPSLIPTQPDWSDLVAQDDGIQASNPPIVDFADFISNGVDAIPEAGPSTESEPAPVSSRGRPSKSRGGKSQRQAYLDRLSEDPSYTPRVGAFWGHDERLLAPELRGMSDWWRDRRSGRGRGTGRGRGRGRAEPAEPRESEPQAQPAQPAPSPPPIERTWGHDGFEKMREQDQSHSTRGARGRGRGRGHTHGRGTGRPTRELEQLWTKAPDTHLHVDPTTRPRFPGQGRGIKVNVPGQWRPAIVRVPDNTAPSTSMHVTPKTNAPPTDQTELVVKLPGQQAKVVPVPPAGGEMKPALPEDPVTVLPLQDAPRSVVARLPAGADSGRPEIRSVPAPASSSTPKGSATADPDPHRNVPAPIPPADKQPPSKAIPRAPAHGRTRSQLDAVAFARTVVPIAESTPLAFGSLAAAAPTPNSDAPPARESAPAPDPAPVPVQAPGELPALAITVPPPIIQALPNPVASFTPPPGSAYTPHGHNPYAYAYTPLDGAAYYSTATPPPPQPHMYYPQAPFFAPPRPSGPVSIRPPGESAPEESRPGPTGSVPAPPMWNYYTHSHSHSHSHPHGSYYSPSGTPYPHHPPQRGYYGHGGEYVQPSEYGGMYDGYAAPGAHVYY